MKSDRRNIRECPELVELGTASVATLGLPMGDIIEPIGFWSKNGISDE